MRIALLADPLRKEKDLPLIREAKKIFSKSLYVPISQARFDLGGEISIKYNGKDLREFDCILPIPTFRFRELFYAALRILCDLVLPFDAGKYFMVSNEAILLNYLSKNGIKTKDFFTVASNVSLEKMVKKIKFPVLLKYQTKRAIVTNSRTLRDVISIPAIGTPIKIENISTPEKTVWVLVTKEIFGYERIGKEVFPLEINGKLKKLSLRVRELINCDYCAMKFIKHKKWIFGTLTLSPNFSRFEKITGKNVAEHIISCLKEKVEEKRKLPAWQKILRRLFR